MITYQNLSVRPSAFQSMTGLSVAAFDALYAQFAPAHAERLSRTLTKRHRKPRRHAAGGGRCHRHSLQYRLVLALTWLRVYPTLEVLGFFFSKMRSAAAVMDASPDVPLVINAKEQRIQRPGGEDDKGDSRQKPFYSGKKKAHTLKTRTPSRRRHPQDADTLKTQVAVDPQGRFLSVSGSVPGGANHDLTRLRATKLLDKMAPGEAAMMDKGYDGITKDYPDTALFLPHKARRNRPLTEEQKAYNRHLSRDRIIVEHSLVQANQFQALAQVFRHGHDRHPQAVRIVAGLVNRRLDKRPLKSYGLAPAKDSLSA